MTDLKPRPYASGDPVAEYNENVTGDTAEAFGVSNVVPVIVTDPVRVEDYPPRYITTDQVPVTALVAARVAPANRDRATVTIRPLTAAVIVGPEGLTPATGYHVLAGETLTLTSTGAVFALAATADDIVCVLSEYRD